MKELTKKEKEDLKVLKLCLQWYKKGIEFERRKNDRNMATKIQG
jgi:hypothetical protein